MEKSFVLMEKVYASRRTESDLHYDSFTVCDVISVYESTASRTYVLMSVATKEQVTCDLMKHKAEIFLCSRNSSSKCQIPVGFAAL